VRHWIFSQPLLMSLMIASLPVCAQQSSTTAPAASTTATQPSEPAQSQPAQSTTAPANTAPAAPAAPSDDTLKRAKAAGLHAETRKGATVYCYEDATIGTHFTTKKCVDPSQLDALIAQRQAIKDATLQRPMTGTGSR
jgi:hypothetical protein